MTQILSREIGDLHVLLETFMCVKKEVAAVIKGDSYLLTSAKMFLLLLIWSVKSTWWSLHSG